MKTTLWCITGAVGAVVIGGFDVAPARGQTLLYSFETLYSNPNNPVPDPMGTLPDGYHPNGGLTTITRDTIGATVGDHSMKFAQTNLATFTGALTALGAPFPDINAPTTTAIALDYTVAPGEEFVGGFANMGITEFGTNKLLGEGSAQTVPSAEQPIKLAAGTYRLFIPLIARNNPYTFDLDVSFSSIVGPDPNTQMTPTSFQFYVNKGATTGQNPVPNAPLTGYIDNVRTVSSQTSTWNNDIDADWSADGNWLGLPARVPNGADAIAMFALGPPISGMRTINVDQPRTVGTLYFNNGAGYTLAGTNAITMDVSGGEASIIVNTGSHTITAPLVLADNTTMDVGPPSNVLTVSGPLTATGVTITKSGAGRADLPSVDAAGLVVNAGTARILAGSATSRVSNLTIAGGASPTAKLDLTDNALVVDYSGASPFETIRAQVTSAYAGGSWAGNGIGSSLANTSEFAVGYAEASSLATVPAVFGTVDSTTVLLRHTRSGDATLDGLVNLADFNRLAANFGASSATWVQGDFNYDSIVNLADFNRLAANFGLSAGPDGVVDPQDWANLAAAIPEPASSGLVLGFAAALRSRRRRRM